jgi:hypothetical protein
MQEISENEELSEWSSSQSDDSNRSFDNELEISNSENEEEVKLVLNKFFFRKHKKE